MRLFNYFIFFLISSFFIVACFGKENENCQVMFEESEQKVDALNVFGEPLALCCMDPKTGFYRNGFCQTGRDDYGTHIVCARMTDEFLQYSKTQGNDLITPNPDFHFPGLKAGDHWCLCISRWLEAVEVGVAPPVNLAATHQNALKYCSKDLLSLHSIAKLN